MALASPAIVNIFRSSAKVIDVSSKKNVLSSASSLSRHKSPNSVTHNKLFHSFSIENIPKFVYNDESKRFTSSAAKQKRYCFYIFLCNNCVILPFYPNHWSTLYCNFVATSSLLLVVALEAARPQQNLLRSLVRDKSQY